MVSCFRGRGDSGSREQNPREVDMESEHVSQKPACVLSHKLVLNESPQHLWASPAPGIASPRICMPGSNCCELGEAGDGTHAPRVTTNPAEASIS